MEPQEPTQPVQPISQPEQSVNVSKKSPLLKIVLGIVILILVAGGAYLLGTKNNNQSVQVPSQYPTSIPTVVPTTDPTANWKTYSNLDYNIKYPSDLIVKPITEASFGAESKVNIYTTFTTLKKTTPPAFLSGLQIASQDYGCSPNCKGYKLYIWVFNNPQNISVNQWIQQYDYYPNSISEPSDKAPQMSKTIDGQTAMVGIPDVQFPSEGIFLSKNNKMFYIFATSNLSSKDTIIQDVSINQILSTFKFTN